MPYYNPTEMPWYEDPVGELIGPDALEQFENMRAYADSSRNIALQYLDELQAANYDVPTITVQQPPDVSEPDPTVSFPVSRPQDPDTTMSLPADPQRPTIDQIIIGDISGIPSFDVATVTVTLPVRPDMPDEIDPGDPDPLATIDYPAKPVYTFPAVPTLHEASIPSAPSLNMPTFEGVMPVDNLVDPTNTFSFSETMYSSELLTNTTNKINTDVVNGGTGLGATIETAIWDRQEERDKQALQEAIDKAESQWAESAFGLPDGVLTTAIEELIKEHENNRLQASREIAIKQAELAQANTHFAVEKAISLEQNLMQFVSQMAQRQLEAAKALIDASVAIFNAQVAKYNAQIEGYKAQAVVYEARIRAVVSQVEIFKAQVEAAKLTIDMDNAYVELYKAQLGGVQALIDCYKSEMEGARIKADVERLKLEAFKAKIDAYVAKVNGHVAMFNAYEASIRGEVAKVQMYGIQVDAYRSRVQASQIEANILTERARVESEVQKNTIQIYAADVDAFKSKVEAEKVRIEAIIDAYKGQIEAYKTDATVAASEIDAEVKIYEGRIKEAAMLAENYIKQAEVSLKAFTDTMTVRTEIAKAQAQVAAQLAASSMAGVNVSAGINETDHKQKSYTTSNSYDTRYSEDYNAAVTTRVQAGIEEYKYYNYNYYP